MKHVFFFFNAFLIRNKKSQLRQTIMSYMIDLLPFKRSLLEEKVLYRTLKGFLFKG